MDPTNNINPVPNLAEQPMVADAGANPQVNMAGGADGASSAIGQAYHDGGVASGVTNQSTISTTVPQESTINTPGAQSAPQAPVMANSTTDARPSNMNGPVNIPTPVTPIINPVKPQSNNPVFRPGGIADVGGEQQSSNGVANESSVPLQAADPVPGSIGSAISGPTTSETTMASGVFGTQSSAARSVSFTDPAMQSDTTASQAVSSGKKKMNKNSLIALVVVAVMVVIALVAVLVLQLMNNG